MDWDVAVHNTRVLNDGGSVPDLITTDRNVKLLKQAGLWESCVFFADTARGVKKDGNQYVSKVYDLKANADLLQSTGTAQPKYDNGSLLYDGGDYILSSTLPENNPIKVATTNVTVICWAKKGVYNASSYIMSRFNGGNFPFVIAFGNNASTYNKLRLIVSDGTNQKQYYSQKEYADNQFHQIAITFSPNSLTCYVDGYMIAVTKSTDGTVNSLLNVNNAVAVGASSLGGAILPNNSKTALHQIYNTTLTAEQILWNYNNIRPEGV